MRKTGYREVAVPGQVNEDEGQRHRIRPAGQPDQHTAAGRKQTLTPDGATDLLVKRSQIPKPKAQNPKPKAQNPSPLGFGLWGLGFGSAGGRTRTADPALMRRVL